MHLYLYGMMKEIKYKKEGSTLTKQKFLNFAEISKSVSFSEFLDWLNIPYQQIDKELKGEGFPP